jgi:hypothetical protein
MRLFSGKIGGAAAPRYPLAEQRHCAAIPPNITGIWYQLLGPLLDGGPPDASRHGMCGVPVELMAQVRNV